MNRALRSKQELLHHATNKYESLTDFLVIPFLLFVLPNMPENP